MIEFNPNAKAQNLTKLEWMAGMVASGAVCMLDICKHDGYDGLDAARIVRMAKLILSECHQKESIYENADP